jgi:hypothetical protein
MLNRYFLIVFGLVLGIAIGLVYAWVVQPIHIVESTPNTLREDYRADLVLMIAEAFEAEADIDLALQRFDRLGLDNPLQVARDALTYAQDHGYKALELQRLSGLISTMEQP